MSETNGVCVVCGRPEWTTAVALSGKVSPFNACHRVKGDPITFNTIDCYKTGYQNRSAQLTRAHAEGKAEGRREMARQAAGAMCWRCAENPDHDDTENCSAFLIREPREKP